MAAADLQRAAAAAAAAKPMTASSGAPPALETQLRGALKLKREAAHMLLTGKAQRGGLGRSLRGAVHT